MEKFILEMFPRDSFNVPFERHLSISKAAVVCVLKTVYKLLFSTVPLRSTPIFLVPWPHCVPKILKSQPRGAGPKFIYHVKGGCIVISKNI